MSLRRNVLIGCTGSVASIKLPELIQQLQQLDVQVEIKVVATENATHFVDPDQLPVHVYRDREEWQMWHKRDDPVLHIELRRWADVMVIAPLDANSLAKIAAGICDNLLLCIVRAWDMKKPLLFAPAMNTYMYEHPITRQHIETLVSWGYQEIPAIEKRLVCGDVGIGAMAEVKTIAEMVKRVLACSGSVKDEDH